MKEMDRPIAIGDRVYVVMSAGNQGESYTVAGTVVTLENPAGMPWINIWTHNNRMVQVGHYLAMYRDKDQG